MYRCPAKWDESPPDTLLPILILDYHVAQVRPYGDIFLCSYFFDCRTLNFYSKGKSTDIGEGHLLVYKQLQTASLMSM